MSIRRLASVLVHGFARSLPYEIAITISRTLLAGQGFGGGGTIASSGELGVYKLVSGPAPILFDVGGHTGEYTEAFLKVHPGGISHVFEPSRAHFELLKKRLGTQANVTLTRSALGASPGELPLFKDAEITGLASLTKRRLDHYGIAMDVAETVTVQTIDDVVTARGIDRIDLLKIDVEGHEMDVLKGAQRTFAARSIRLVQFEFGGCNLDTKTSVQDFYYFFRDIGFRLGVVRPTGRLKWLPKYDEFLEQYRTTNFVAQPVD
jgi:FkbM family methyltransferase